MKVYKITQTQIFTPIIFFLVKNRIKKGYYRNENLSLAWDRMEVCQVALCITTNNYSHSQQN